MRGPVERAQEGARGDGGVGGRELPAADAVGDERADASFVAIPLGDDLGAHARRQRRDFQVGGGSLDLVDDAEDVRDGEIVQARAERPAIPARARQRAQEAVERPILAEEEQLVLAAEVVIGIAGREVGGDGDVAHAGGGEAARPEGAGGRPQDLHAPRVGAA